MGYEREYVRRTSGYVPGKQPASIRAVKLNTNENPYPPAKAVLEALTRVPPEALRRYPPPLADSFRETAAALHGVDRDNVIAVNGGDELIRLAIATFVDEGRPIGVLEPGYSLYPVLASLHGSPLVEIELNGDWSLPADAAHRFNSASASLVFLVNPQAPSGHLVDVEAVERLAAELNGVLVVDEAYVDFVDPERQHDAVPMIRGNDNVIQLRTLSKGYSLAGLRFGYGIGHAGLIGPMLLKTRDSYNVDAIAQILAEHALKSRADAALTWQAIRAARSALALELTQLGFRITPSQTNFLLARVPEHTSAAELSAELESHAIYVRFFDTPRLRDSLRVTVGTPEQNAALLAALKELLEPTRGK